MIGGPPPASSAMVRDLRVECPRDRILARLQYRRAKSRLEGATQERLGRTIDRAFWLCEPRGLLRIGKVEPAENGVMLEFSGGQRFQWESDSLRSFFKGCTHCGVMAATVGASCENERQRLMSSSDLFSSVVYDAVGSETADAAMDTLDGDLRRLVQLWGGSCTKRRFSSGYGDLDLSTQADVDRILDLSRIDISVGDRYFLHPEKSVTAVIGIFQP